eukprot:Skav212030  [mRNA]  locus=scaffold1285:31426:33033:- [translate_table: standard]
MHAVQEQIAFAEERGLFRAASAWSVTSSLLLSRRTFHCPLPKVSRCDVFISHSWSCPKWIKFLAICHYLNLDLAIVLSLCACLLALVLLVLYAGKWSGVAQLSEGLLCSCLVCWPMAVFIVSYLFGHVCLKRTFWFDSVCVDQSNAFLKAESLRALPAFIAQSSKMLILWDDTIFERLWCNYELAIYSKTSLSPGAFKVVPMWVPMWTFAWLAIWLVFLSCVLIYKLDEVPSLDTTSRSSIVVSAWNAYCLPPLVYLTASVPVSWFCLQKLKFHKLMLDQMSQFDLRNAKCSLETDRVVLTEQVVSLFDEAFAPPLRVAFDVPDDDSIEAASDAPLMSSRSFRELQNVRHVTSYPTNDEIVDQFNLYVKGALRDIVVASLGEEDHISFNLCVGTCLPFLLLGLKSTVDCEGYADCLEPAAKWGIDSANQFSLLDGFFSVLIFPSCFLISSPLMLRANHFVAGIVQDSLPRLVLGSLLSAIMMFVVYSLGVLECTFLLVVVIKHSHAFLVALVVGLGVLLGTIHVLFFCTADAGPA